MTEDLALIANRHWIGAYRGLIADVGGKWREFGRVHAFTSDIPLPFANGCLALEPASETDLEQAIGLASAHGLPYRVRIDPLRAASVLEVPARLGLVAEEWRMPAMVLKPVPPAPPAAVGVSTHAVTDAASHDVFIAILVETGFSRELALRAFGMSLLNLPDVALFTASLDGKPAGTSVLYRTGDVAGVYSVATVEGARRRGVGTAVTWAAVSQARAWGCSAVVLQATDMGLPVYRAMGFETVVEYVSYMPAGDTTPA